MKERTRDGILLLSLIAAVVTIPLHNNINSIALIVFVAACAIGSGPARAMEKLRRSRLWMIPAAYFLLLATSYFWDSSGGFPFNFLERYALFLFIPPAMAVMPRLSRRSLRVVALSFVAIVSVICLFCLVRAYEEYRITGDGRVFYYHYLSMQAGLNAVFLSSFCLASIAWLFYFFFILKSPASSAGYAMAILIGLFLSGMMFLLSSKLNLFLLAALVAFMILRIGRGKNKRRSLISIIIIVALAVSALLAVYKLPYLRWRINVTEVSMYRGPEDDNNGIAIRLLMWRTAVGLIEKKPFQGYGIRGARQEMMEQYRLKGFRLGYEQGYHSHNQYLETALMTGIPGLLLLLAMVARFAWRAVRAGNVLLMFILVQFAMQSLIGSPFEAQQELVFYMFFMFLFYYHSPGPDKQL